MTRMSFDFNFCFHQCQYDESVFLKHDTIVKCKLFPVILIEW